MADNILVSSAVNETSEIVQIGVFTCTVIQKTLKAALSMMLKNRHVSEHTWQFKSTGLRLGASSPYPDQQSNVQTVIRTSRPYPNQLSNIQTILRARYPYLERQFNFQTILGAGRPYQDQRFNVLTVLKASRFYQDQRTNVQTVFEARLFFSR